MNDEEVEEEPNLDFLPAFQSNKINLLASISVTAITFVYNIGFAFVLFLWIFREKIPFIKKLVTMDIRNLIAFATIFVILACSINLFYIEANTDVDDAIEGAVIAFLDGSNPYVDKVVPHILPNGTEITSVYHYFPPDLISYSFFYLLLGNLPLIRGFWFFLANVVLAIAGYFFMRKLILEKIVSEYSKDNSQKEADIRLAAVYSIFLSPFILNNAVLMLVLFLAGLNLQKIGKETVGMIAHVLSASVKYMTGLFIVIWFIDDFESSLGTKDFKVIFKTFIPYIIGGTVLLILCLPFGIIETISSVFLYQGNIEQREQVAGVYGPILIEILKILSLKQLFFIIFITIMIISVLLLFTAFKEKTSYEKQMILCFIAIFTLPFFGAELFLVTLFAWILDELGYQFPRNLN